MKTTIAIIIALILAVSLTATAQPPAQATSADDACQKTEYAELRDTPKADLLSLYCHDEAFASIENDGFNSFMALAEKYGNGPELDSAHQHRLQAAQCWDEAARVTKVLVNIHHIKTMPTKEECDTQKWNSPTVANKKRKP